ncbi:MAG: hypothetical protein U1A24_04725 [Cypionkella sp.]|uniref:hypothetical protein n=1 Tax=Cypionkella sp. TaxID=2811411 RepID=UPI002AB853D5|nr:hypothetical protein [Cypionkella sp.]MDZ4309846.1 hypothetical protein [Cypionkella sp.]
MTQTLTLNASARSLGLILAAPFVGFAKLMMLLAEAHTRLQQVERLSATSDAQLAAAGKTRESEMRRIFGLQLYL